MGPPGLGGKYFTVRHHRVSNNFTPTHLHAWQPAGLGFYLADSFEPGGQRQRVERTVTQEAARSLQGKDRASHLGGIASPSFVDQPVVDFFSVTWGKGGEPLPKVAPR